MDNGERRVAIELRAIRDEDVEAYFDLLNDPVLAANSGSVPHPIDRAWAQERLETRRREEADGSRAEYGLYRDGQLVGTACWFVNEQDEMEIGYAVHRNERGRGLAGVAAKLIIEQVRARGHGGAIFAHYFKDNDASGKVLEKLGFARERSAEGVSPARAGAAPMWVMKLAEQIAVEAEL